jgi:hypothetical protein
VTKIGHDIEFLEAVNYAAVSRTARIADRAIGLQAEPRGSQQERGQ